MATEFATPASHEHEHAMRGHAPADRPLAAAVDTAEMWRRAPTLAHKLWRQSLQHGEHAYAPHTTEHLASLFGRFCSWLAGRQLSLAWVNTADIGQFLDDLQGRHGAPASARTKRTYLGEIDRVMSRLVELGVRKAKPSQMLVEQMRITVPLRPRQIVLPEDGAADAIAAHVEALLAQDPALDVLSPRPLMAAAIVALMLQGGCMTKEVQKVRMRHLRVADPQGRRAVVYSPGHRLVQDREVELRGWAASCVMRWWDARRAMIASAAPKVMPRSGESIYAFSVGRKPTALSSDLLHRTVVDLCARASAHATQEGRLNPQVLRNMFIAGLILEDEADDKIARRAGLLATDQIVHVRNALGLPGRRRAGATPLKFGRTTPSGGNTGSEDL